MCDEEHPPDQLEETLNNKSCRAYCFFCGRDRLLLDAKEQTLFVTNHGEPLHPDSLTEYARRYIQGILGHEKLDTTQIYTRTSLRKLLEVHGATHPAERPEEPTSEDDELPDVG